MANANIALITTNKTFDEWRVATNDLITDRNILRNSDYFKDDGDFLIGDGKIQISRSAGGTTFTNDNDALIGGVLTTTDLTVVDDAIIGGNAAMISAHTRLTVNNNVYTKNLESNSLITAANVNANGYVTIAGIYKDVNNNILNVNSFLTVASTGNVDASGNVTVGGLLKANKSTGTGLQVTANAVVDGNLTVGTNGFVSQNLNVTNWVNSTGLRAEQLVITAFANLNSANITTGNITTARIVTLNVNTASAIAEVANLVVANSRTKNAYIESLTVGNELAKLNVAVLTVTNQLNAVSANIGTLEVVSLSVKDPIQAPSESDSSSYRLRVSQTTPGDGFFGVYQGSPQRGNALIQFNSSTSSWRLTSNSTQGLYSTILTSSNVLTSVTSTSTSEAASASSVKTAYDQAIVALAQANAASNLVSVLANGVVRVANANINFNNTSTINVSVTGGGSRLANVEFNVNTSVITNQTIARNAYDQANTSTTVARNAYDQANTATTNAGTAGTNATTATNIGRAAYDQANTATTQVTNARAAANSAANTVRVSANSGSTLSARQLNFINTSTVTVTVTANPDGSNANVAFTSIGGGSGTPGGSNRQIQFNNNGSFGGSAELIYDSANQRFGVGTSAPTTRLDVSQSGSPGTIVDAARIYADASGTAEVRTLFGTFANPVGAAIGVQTNLADAATLKFYTETGGALVEKMRIAPDGNVGIRTSDPKVLMQVGGSSDPAQLRIHGGTAFTSFPELQLYGGSSAHNWTIRGHHTQGLSFAKGTNGNYGTELLRILDDGNVGIGTSAPYKKIEVVGGGISVGPIAAGSSQLGIELGDLVPSSIPTNQVRAIIGVSDSAPAEGRLAGDLIYQPRSSNDAVGSHRFIIQGQETVTIAANRNVGIAQPNPVGRLHVADTSGGALVYRAPIVGYGELEYFGGPGSVFRIGPSSCTSMRIALTYTNSSGTRIEGLEINSSGTVTIPGALTVGGASVRDASILTSGTVASARLPGNMLRHVTSGYIGGNVFVAPSSNPPTAGAVGDIWIEI